MKHLLIGILFLFSSAIFAQSEKPFVFCSSTVEFYSLDGNMNIKTLEKIVNSTNTLVVSTTYGVYLDNTYQGRIIDCKAREDSEGITITIKIDNNYYTNFYLSLYYCKISSKFKYFSFTTSKWFQFHTITNCKY